MSTWYGTAPPPDRAELGLRDWLRVLRRGLPVAGVVFGGLALLLVLRLVERPLCGARRPVTPVLTTLVCRATLWLMGLGYGVDGAPMRGIGAQVANHASWLDIFVLNASQQVCFVSKAEVARWPGIGWLARATGTLFITRDRRDAAAQTAQFRARTLLSQRLVFFPEGTSSDGLRVLPFKTTLFEAFFAQDLRAVSAVQPVSVMYSAPPGSDPRCYGWWGDMEFADHLLQVLALSRQGSVRVVFHPPIPVADCADRKEIARRCEEVIRTAHRAHQKSAITS
jgi:1-acyl-sn-glycerol-3-phosphate acyltransferase